MRGGLLRGASEKERNLTRGSLYRRSSTAAASGASPTRTRLPPADARPDAFVAMDSAMSRRTASGRDRTAQAAEEAARRTVSSMLAGGGKALAHQPGLPRRAVPLRRGLRTTAGAHQTTPCSTSTMRCLPATRRLDRGWLTASSSATPASTRRNPHSALPWWRRSPAATMSSRPPTSTRRSLPQRGPHRPSSPSSPSTHTSSSSSAARRQRVIASSPQPHYPCGTHRWCCVHGRASRMPSYRCCCSRSTWRSKGCRHTSGLE